MKPDIKLEQDVAAELRYDPITMDAEIGVAVRDGVVTLTGHVHSFAQKYAARYAVERVRGVRAVANDTTVQLPGAHARNDTELAHAVAEALAWHVQVPDAMVKATVEDGRVTLLGEVEWNYERLAAESAVRSLTGVRSITNLITVKPVVEPREVTKRIRRALHRSAEADARSIAVETRAGTVTLRGAVRSQVERAEAERAAWSAPGVTNVDDRLVVAVL